MRFTYAFDLAGRWLPAGYALTAWYYCNSNGAMQFGWKEIGGSWYYLDPQDGYICRHVYSNQRQRGIVLIQNGTHVLPDGIRLVMAGIISTIMAWLMALKSIGGTWYFSMDIG